VLYRNPDQVSAHADTPSKQTPPSLSFSFPRHYQLLPLSNSIIFSSAPNLPYLAPQTAPQAKTTSRISPHQATMEDRNTPAPERLLELPRELRDMIYAYLGCSDTVLLLRASDGIFFQDHRRHPVLLQICRAITAETTSKVFEQQLRCPALSLTMELGEPVTRLPNILRMIEAGENPKDPMYKGLLTTFPVDTKIQGISPFYHGRKRLARRILELRILVTKGCTKRDSRKLDDLLRSMAQLYDKYYFVFVVGKEMETEWRACLEKKEELEEIGSSMEVLSRIPVVGLD
jgi:hypothetical protein